MARAEPLWVLLGSRLGVNNVATYVLSKRLLTRTIERKTEARP